MAHSWILKSYRLNSSACNMLCPSYLDIIIQQVNEEKPFDSKRIGLNIDIEVDVYHYFEEWSKQHLEEDMPELQHIDIPNGGLTYPMDLMYSIGQSYILVTTIAIHSVILDY